MVLRRLFRINPEEEAEPFRRDPRRGIEPLERMNDRSLCGLLAGSMTDPSALAFANAMSKSDAPSVAYATVSIR